LAHPCVYPGKEIEMRLNLRLSGSAETLFTSLSSRLKLSTRDLTLDALGLLYYAVAETGKGGTLGIMKDGEFTALVTPSLQAVAEEAANGQVTLDSKATTTDDGVIPTPEIA